MTFSVCCNIILAVTKYMYLIPSVWRALQHSNANHMRVFKHGMR